MTQTSYLNSPVKCCKTCVHREASEHGVCFDKCSRFAMYCSVAMSSGDLCGRTLSEWRSAPPRTSRRSILQWLYDSLVA